MKEWLESVVEKLIEEPDNGSGKHLVAAVAIAYCFHKYVILKADLDKFTLPLLSMLQLRPNVERKFCPDYDLLCSFLTKEERYSCFNFARMMIFL